MKVLELVMHTCVRNTRKLALNHWVTENLILNHDNECLKQMLYPYHCNEVLYKANSVNLI